MFTNLGGNRVVNNYNLLITLVRVYTSYEWTLLLNPHLKMFYTLLQWNSRDSANVFTIFQFRPRDDSFGRLRLYNLSHAPESMKVCANRTVVTSQMNSHMI